MKGLLLRVGIEKGTGGILAPIYEDGSFEFIPKPETRATSERKIYLTMKGVNLGKPLRELVNLPQKLCYAHPHCDPEFLTFTYGDPTSPKRNQLSRLDPKDLLVFYAGLKYMNGKEKGKARLFVIGYFVVEKVYDFKKIPKERWERVFKELENNAHSKIYFRLRKLGIDYSDNNLVIVKGYSKSSKLFSKALPLGDNNDNIRQDLAKIFGYNGSLRRAIGHKIDEEHIYMVKNG